MAFWINAYNAATLQLVLDHYPIQRSSALGLLYPENSVRQIGQAWEIGGVHVGSKRFTLNQIAHEILRKRFADPRVLFAMASAARGSPALLDEAYVAEQLEAQLDAAARSFLRDSEHGFRLDPAGNTIWLSRIFAWYGRDFVAGFSRGPFSVGPRHSEQEAAVLNFIKPLLPPEQQAVLEGGDFTVAYLPYDWSLNGL